jgi:hypothetical protein
MKTYKVCYSGNASKFKNFETTVNANSEREAVEDVYQQIMDENYFPQEDGSIKDCDCHEIATATDVTIDYDGGCFFAEITTILIYPTEENTYQATIDGKDYDYDDLDDLKIIIEDKGYLFKIEE